MNLDRTSGGEFDGVGDEIGKDLKPKQLSAGYLAWVPANTQSRYPADSRLVHGFWVPGGCAWYLRGSEGTGCLGSKARYQYRTPHSLCVGHSGVRLQARRA
eukprot:2673046-Rhodomonas_salina.1